MNLLFRWKGEAFITYGNEQHLIITYIYIYNYDIYNMIYIYIYIYIWLSIITSYRYFFKTLK
jgi:hypothetical protein